MKSSQHLSAVQALRRFKKQHKRRGKYSWLSYDCFRTYMYLSGLRDRTVYVSSVYVRPAARGKGHGNRGLTAICKWADKNQITLRLYASRYDNGLLSTAKLKRWYRSFGFKGTFEMHRMPVCEKL